VIRLAVGYDTLPFVSDPMDTPIALHSPSAGTITLQMPEDFLERHGIPVDVQGSNVAAVFGLLTKLFFEELGKIRRCSKNLADAGLFDGGTTVLTI
jgi:hypothetical protein